VPANTLRALARRGLLEWKRENISGWQASGYAITDAGRQWLQERDGMGGGTPDTSLDVLVDDLAAARKATQLAKEAYEAELAKYPQLAKYQELMKLEREREQGAYDALASAAVEVYAETGDKRPHSHVNINMMKRLEYDPATALEWAKTEARYLLILDEKRFKSGMLKAKIVPEFITRHEEPQAKIDKDLDND